ncbi:LuxR C-terminal-related transcriptional regulator [Salipiger sp. 1_MG-2023]|uniref:helix-turn-helix transcriptional regulator n=1 Tax=Salipiger sp. 1_MG-2023 TaxID=3062665 RepID=UPI0026E15F50|nr:LuxR C-terminal-related transcriptional regulator [Salipiger sp. 1_MG-2023]MDO6585894.1 LuxR C-terminal-related transcriptional regulator [Salipiger sp. 1_MG-2023]
MSGARVAERSVFVVLLAVQLCCTGFFLYDILSSLLGLRIAPIDWQIYELIEIGAAVGLLIGVAVTAKLLLRSLSARDKAEDSLRLASGAFLDVLEERFAEWSLTPAERDVAMMAIKGFPIAEIARMRGVSDGTVKAQTNAIYRKAGVSGRTQLLSLFIDELLDGQVEARLLPKA